MDRIKGTVRLRMRSLGIGAVVAAVLLLNGSCFFDTKTTLCGTSGLRCPSGWVCSADQDACIEVGTCGDRVVDGGEVCDDGNRANGDGCSADCTSDESCGNGEVDAIRGEFCDDGNQLDGDGCSASCAAEMCGNFVLDAKFGEVCDDGNGESGDGCSADCRSNEACGNNVIDTNLGEECEFADSPFPKPTSNIVTCDSDCTLPMCGDGHLNPEYALSPQGDREQCDTGGDSESCDGDCSFVGCGDGHTNMAAGEQCDTGDPNMNTAGCNGQTCKYSACPDSIHNSQAGEECDTGGNSQACNADCMIPECGDGFTNPEFVPFGMTSPEECDSGGMDGPACDFDCTKPLCGDAHENTMAGEECDDGNNSNSDFCVTGSGGICRDAECGDGHHRTQGPDPEPCDTGGDSESCDVDCSPRVCGDGYKNMVAGEQCDPPGSSCGGAAVCGTNCMCPMSS